MVPVSMYFIFGSLEIVVPIYVPGLDEEKLKDYIILLCYQVFMMVYSSFATFVADLLPMTLVLHMWPMCLIFEHMLAELSTAAECEINRKSVELKRALKNIIRLHQEICS